MMDTLVFLNGHLLEECKDDKKFGELVAESGKEMCEGTLYQPQFSYTNIYHWQRNGSSYCLHFMEPLREDDRIDLLDSVSGKRETRRVSGGTRFSIVVDLEVD